MNGVTYMVERWRDVYLEMMPLWQGHWEEIAIHRDAIPLDPDVAEYQRLEDAGILSVVVGRHEGEVIGYYISFVKPHLHYRSTLHAFTDVYYVVPAFRKGRTGIRLIEAAMAEWKRRGVKKAFTATKFALNMTPVFELLGWKSTENTLTVLL
jgi:L-amino acid N-acyltransferase YncA